MRNYLNRDRTNARSSRATKMVSRRFMLGAGFVYIGFLLFFLGFTTISSHPFDDLVGNLVPINVTQPLRGSIIELAGGFLAVTGLLVCLSSPTKPIAPAMRTRELSDPAPVRGSVSNSGSNCKFCGVPMRIGESFCSSCKRSQA